MIFGINNSNRTVIKIKNRDGSVAGTISITKPKANKKKTKRLNYNFKQISSMIMRSKTANSAGQAVTKARGTIARLQRQLKDGEYDEKELESAIIHAKKMERIAKKRERHLEEEERAKQQGICQFDMEKTEETEEGTDTETEELEEALKEENPELSEEELAELTEEFQDLMKETMEAVNEIGLEELADEFMGTTEKLDPEELELLKKKHRADELREIADADMKYLKAMFDKLEKERQESSSGVSLQLGGVEMPVDIMTEMPVAIEGGNIDYIV